MKLFDLDRIEEIWLTISRNKVRSLLTAFGVFWGIYMLTLMMGTGTGLKQGFVHGIDGFATNSCFLGSASTNLSYNGFPKGREWNIHNKDLKILLDSIPEIKYLSPVLFAPADVNNIVYGDRSETYPVGGVYPNYADIERQHLLYGRFINELDIIHKRKVCVIGTDVYETLFPQKENPVGKEICISGIYYHVIGVTYGISDITIGGMRLEESVLTPLSTLQLINNQGDIVHVLAATSVDNVPASRIEKRIKQVLKAANNIHPDDLQAVWSVNLEEEFNLFINLFAGVDILILIVGSGTLITGVMGIANIMLVTVRERTREIGVRRAIGAKPATIMGQIMAEGLALTALAGFPGLCAGVYTLYLADKYWLQNMENVFFYKPMITFGTATGSIIVLIICGLLAGFMPAVRALRIKAIDAIREE